MNIWLIRRPLQVIRKNDLRLDAIDTNGRERLAMTLFATIPLSAFIFEDNNFLALALSHDLAMDGDPVYIGLADLDIFPIGKYKDIVEGDGCSDFTGELLTLEDITLLDLILLTACGNHCVHDSVLL
jgi:hypothetical protein